jgi:hypothetical protein
MWMLLVSAAVAGEPDFRAEWFELTCDDAKLSESAKAKAVPACSGGRRVGRTALQYKPNDQGSGCRVWLQAWCEGAWTGSFAPGDSPKLPTLYTDDGFRGTALVLEPGERNLGEVYVRDAGADTWNDKAGSIRVPAGLTVRLCTEPGGNGRCWDFGESHPKLGNTYVGNDQASWVQVVKGTLPPVFACPRLFENDGYGGMFFEVCNDVSSFVGTPWNDKASSMLLPPGWVVRVCTDADHGGTCADLKADAWKLGDTPVGSDRITSVRIVSRGR